MDDGQEEPHRDGALPGEQPEVEGQLHRRVSPYEDECDRRSDDAADDELGGAGEEERHHGRDLAQGVGVRAAPHLEVHDQQLADQEEDDEQRPGDRAVTGEAGEVLQGTQEEEDRAHVEAKSQQPHLCRCGVETSERACSEQARRVCHRLVGRSYGLNSSCCRSSCFHSSCYRTTSCRTTSCRTRSCRTRSCRTRSCRTRSCRTRSCRTTSCRTTSCRTTSCRTRSCRTTSCRTRNCRCRSRQYRRPVLS